MSVVGWEALQYLCAATNASIFQSCVMTVAVYTLNAPLDSLTMTYSYGLWKEPILGTSLSASGAPIKYCSPLGIRSYSR